MYGIGQAFDPAELPIRRMINPDPKFTLKVPSLQKGSMN